MKARILATSLLCLLSAAHGVAQRSSSFESIPPPAEGHSIAYDAARGDLVLFGGARFQNSGLPFTVPVDETWQWDGRWTALTPETRPAARRNAALVFDTDRDVVVMFGGQDAARDYVDDTWTWNGVDWSRRSPTSHPSRRSDAALAHDSGRGRTVLFGGWNGSARLADTWEWDGSEWSQQVGTSANPPAATAVAVYDTARARTLLVNALGETWVWDGADWSQLAPSSALPTQLSLIDGIAYDSGRDRVVLVADSATWEWDGADWIVHRPAGQPDARAIRLAYSESIGRVVSFGGSIPNTQLFLPGELATDLALWDGVDWTVHTPRQFPPAIQKHAMAYHAATAEVVAFGGQRLRDRGVCADTWSWDGNAWFSRDPAQHPSARYDHAMARDLAGSLVLFGGRDASVLGDTWTWDGSNWTLLNPPNAPSARADHAMAFDSVRAETLLFGGNDGALRNDTWVFDGANWQQRAPAHSPPPLNDPALAFDSARQRAVLAGLAGSRSQVWEWDGLDWRQVEAQAGSDPTLAEDSLRRVVYAHKSNSVDAWNGVEFVPMVPFALPSQRPGFSIDPAMAYHAATDRLVSFGAVTVGSFPGAIFTFNETIVVGVGEPALFSPFGAGCAGSVATPTLDSGSAPLLGSTFVIQLANLPPSRIAVPFGMVGFSPTSTVVPSLPIDLNAIGMTGCSLYLRPAFDQMLENRLGNATWILPIPNHAGLLGSRFFTQCLVVDPTANPLGLIVTNAGDARIGVVEPWRWQ